MPTCGENFGSNILLLSQDDLRETWTELKHRLEGHAASLCDFLDFHCLLPLFSLYNI
jgi:hypothetical protein